MAAQASKTGLLAKIQDRLKKGHEVHKDDEINYGQMDLPAGIANGIAQLVDCKFDLYKDGDRKGKIYFYAAGVVKAPEDHNGTPLLGLRTSIMEPLCDTPDASKRKTIEDHQGWIYNQLWLLGVKKEQLTPTTLESVCAALKKAKVHFRFRTWQGKPTKEYPDPRVNHDWKGIVEYDESNPDSHTEDSSPAAESNGELEEDATEEATDATETETETTDIASLDLTALGKAADKKPKADMEAQQTLMAAGLQVGMTEKEMESATNWAAVAKEVGKRNEAAGGEEETSEETTEEETTEEATEEEEWKPAKEEVYLYKPLDPTTKKRAAKGVECEVLEVDEEKKTVTILNLDNKKTKYAKIPWDKLETA